jgi:hypothetical protein
MTEYFYNVSYLLHENGEPELKTAIIRATNPLSQDGVKDFLRGLLRKPGAVITITKQDSIPKEEYVARGGDEVAPWVSGPASEEGGQ